MKPFYESCFADLQVRQNGDGRQHRLTDFGIWRCTLLGNGGVACCELRGDTLVFITLDLKCDVGNSSILGDDASLEAMNLEYAIGRDRFASDCFPEIRRVGSKGRRRLSW